MIATTAGLCAQAQTAPASASAARVPTDNPPWYPSLQAFEHYDSARSHVFSEATFDGSLTGPNRVDLQRSRPGAYPSGYNTAYLDSKDMFIQGGSYGNIKGSIGPYVAKVNPRTLRPIWYTQLRNTRRTREWDYPGGMAIMDDGFIYVVSGYRIYKVSPKHGRVVKTLRLPTMVHMRNNYPETPPTYDEETWTQDARNTSYNGINALPDGTIILKSLYRQAGCKRNGPSAILNCPKTRDVPASILVSVDPKTMRIRDKITLPAFAGARPTITRYHGVDYVYLLENTSSPVRYSVKNGQFTLDESWTPPALPAKYENQTTGGSLIIMNNWVLGATNSVPAGGHLTMFAINQNDASDVLYSQPYANDPVPPLLSRAFEKAAAGETQAVSWAGMSLEADPANGLFYGVETLARKVAAFRIGPEGIETVWEKPQTTTEWATLIGPKDHRIWVGTNIPGAQIPGQNHNDTIVYRDAATGRLLAVSGRVPAMTPGSAIQPGYNGSVFFPGAKGTLVKATPHPAG
ncbi:MAG: hypothetical protein JST31_00290 [Actinobacteria bacterium]|nr:hypothetical protein [Actinomycetota bacterium]